MLLHIHSCASKHPTHVPSRCRCICAIVMPATPLAPEGAAMVQIPTALGLQLGTQSKWRPCTQMQRPGIGGERGEAQLAAAADTASHSLVPSRERHGGRLPSTANPSWPCGRAQNGRSSPHTWVAGRPKYEPRRWDVVTKSAPGDIQQRAVNHLQHRAERAARDVTGHSSTQVMASNSPATIDRIRQCGKFMAGVVLPAMGRQAQAMAWELQKFMASLAGSPPR
jgi:hypothetical protein